MKIPTCEELELLSKWPRNNVFGLVEFLNGLWWLPQRNILFVEAEDKFILELKTMSWHGNEEIIHALMDNVIFWNHHWRESRPGKYIFEFKKDENGIH